MGLFFGRGERWEKRKITLLVLAGSVFVLVEEIKIAFGFFVNIDGDEKEIEQEVNQMISKLSIEEKEIVELIYKEKLDEKEEGKRLGKSKNEVNRTRRNALSKISHDYYNENLKKFIVQN